MEVEDDEEEAGIETGIDKSSVCPFCVFVISYSLDICFFELASSIFFIFF